MSTEIDSTEPVSLDPNSELSYCFQEVWYPMIVEKVKIREILSHVTCMRDHAPEIYSKAEQNPKEATELFMKIMKSLTQEGKYQELLQALKTCEYPIIVKAIETGSVKQNDMEHRRLVQIVMAHHFDKIDVQELNLKLLASEVINKNDYDTIKRQAERDPLYARSELILIMLPRRHPEWFHRFLDALYEMDQVDLCRMLGDEKWLAAKRRDMGELDSDTGTGSDQGNDGSLLEKNRFLLSSEELRPPQMTHVILKEGEALQGKLSSDDGSDTNRGEQSAGAIGGSSECLLINPSLISDQKFLRMQGQLDRLVMKVEENSMKLDEILSLLKNDK